MSKLSQNGFYEGRDFIVQLVRNITNITYGRDMSYAVEQETFEESMPQISVTKIRKEIGLD